MLDTWLRCRWYSSSHSSSTPAFLSSSSVTSPRSSATSSSFMEPSSLYSLPTSTSRPTSRKVQGRPRLQQISMPMLSKTRLSGWNYTEPFTTYQQTNKNRRIIPKFCCSNTNLCHQKKFFFILKHKKKRTWKHGFILDIFLYNIVCYLLLSLYKYKTTTLINDCFAGNNHFQFVQSEILIFSCINKLIMSWENSCFSCLFI